MSAFDERRIQDVQKLRQLAEKAPTRLKIGRISGAPPNQIEIELRFRTAPSRRYPGTVQDLTRVTIDLPSRYPLVAPTAAIRTPILHPNVYSSGQICLGVAWMPTLGLDFLVKRIVQIITFDPAVLNEKSPANRDALAWYRDAVQRHANAFPTDASLLATSVPDLKMRWANIATEPAKVVTTCPHCSGKLSLPPGKQGQVKCPRCQQSFEART
ncbi:ubiquitin-conjugating enzyme E2 [Bradyrhizobium oligotrophicum S58]